MSLMGIILILLLHPVTHNPDKTRSEPRVVEAADTEAVIVAIQDEIYDYSYEREFWGFETSGPRGPEARFNIYIKPELTPTQGGVEGTVIYKYPPFGEVIRPFVLATDGTAYLIGKPSNGFPWTQPNTKTIYMDDNEVCRDKHDWRTALFELDLSPNQSRIRAAIQRQKMRVGFSNLESVRKRRALKP